MNTELWDELARRKIIITGGHTGGRTHGSADIRLTTLNTYPLLLQRVGVEIAKPFRGQKIQVVVYLNGRVLPLAHAVAGTISTFLHNPVRTVSVPESGRNTEISGMTMDLVRGRVVLLLMGVVSDINRPQNIRQAVRMCGGVVKGFASLVSSLPPQAMNDFRISTLFTLNHWRPEECPLCRQGIPIRRMAEAAPSGRQR